MGNFKILVILIHIYNIKITSTFAIDGASRYAFNVVTLALTVGAHYWYKIFLSTVYDKILITFYALINNYKIYAVTLLTFTAHNHALLISIYECS